MKRELVFFIAGCVLGSLGDYLHKIFGITVYPSQNLWVHQIPGTPPWTMLLFGFAGVAMGVGYQWFRKIHLYVKLVKFRRHSTVTHAVLGATLFLAIYGLSALIGHWPAPFSDISLGFTVLVFWVLFDGTVGGLLFGIAVSLVGTTVEIILVHEGFFFYGDHLHKFLGVASWLPWIYLAAAVAVTDTSGMFPIVIKNRRRS